AVVKRVKSYQVRSYIPEKQQKGRRNWQDKAEEQQAVYANRRRVRGEYGKSLLRRRGELVERSFAHCYETGGLRRTHLRGHQNILKRQLIHVGAFNLSLILRKLLGAGTPRELRNRFGRLVWFVYLLFWGRINQNRLCRSRTSASLAKCFVGSRIRLRRQPCRKPATCATGLGDGNPFTRTGLCDPANPRDTFIQEPSMHALNAVDGGILWEQGFNHSFAATSLADGVVFSGLVGIEPPALNAYNARSGHLLASFSMPGSVNSAATPVGKMLFVTSGNSSDG